MTKRASGKNRAARPTKKRPQQGSLTVLAGPMFSGKTGKIVAMVEVFARMGHTVAVVKPAIDTRYSTKSEVNSHDNKRAQALLVDGAAPNTILSRIEEEGADKVVIDEVQFFQKSRIKSVVEKLRKRGIDVIVAGLLYDYRRKPFGATPDFMGLADERMELAAICEKCGALARHTERVSGGTSRVEVGAADKYIAVCEKCHVVFR